MYPDQWTPDIDSQRRQTVLLFAKVLNAVKFRCAAQSPAKVVCPAMIPAAQTAGLAPRLSHHQGRTVAADVGEGPQLAPFIADNQDWLTGKLGRQIGAGG